MPFRKESIDELCEGTGLTQRVLGEELGVPQSTIYRWKLKDHNILSNHLDLLYGLAKEYGLNIEFYEKI